MNELNLEIEREEIPEVNCASPMTLQARLRLMENARKEVMGVGLYDPSGQNVNFVDWVQRDTVPTPPLEVFLIAVEDELRTKMATHTAVQYAVMKINGNPANILVARPGRSLVLRGKMSTFGGPNDTGMKPGETLAIIHDADITSVPGVASLFPPGTTKALGRSLLNNQADYIACRWDYKTTPRSYLVKTDVVVRNPVTGKSVIVRPADWGPAEWTNRVADLSDHAALALGLQTNDECEVVIPLPAGISGPVLSAPAGGSLREAVVAVAREQFERYQGVHEANEPLRSRIEKYWDELNVKVPGDFQFTSTSVAWSAVFVSWCLMQGGVTHQDFHFSSAHSQFVFRAIQRRNVIPQGIYPAFRITELPPKPGDIIHNNRPGGALTYDDAAQQPQYESHSAIVVDVGEDDRGPCAITVGGNESQSVGTHRLPLDPATGLLVPRTDSPYIAVVRLS